MQALETAELDRVAGVISQGPYEGYPEHNRRLFLPALGATGLQVVDTRIYIPDGPWHITDHHNRKGVDPEKLDPEVPNPEHPYTSEAQMKRWRSQGLILDQYGRPLHPHTEQLLADPRIGLPTGLGFFYEYAGNGTSDAGIYRYHKSDPTEVFLIQRKIGERWALPGGFGDPTDNSAEDTARREAGEEGSLWDIGGTAEVILQKLAVGLRDTIHAWTQNELVLIHGDQDYLHDTKPIARDDAKDAGWFTEAATKELDIFDAHQLYIGEVFERVKRQRR